MKLSAEARNAIRKTITNHSRWDDVRRARGLSLASMTRDDYFSVADELKIDIQDVITNATVIRTGNTASAAHSATAVLKDYGDEMNGPTFALLNNENLFSLAYCSNDFGKASANGNGCIEYARAKGADFVVAFGNFPRAEERAMADVLLPAGTRIDTAVDAVVNALQRRLDDAA